VTVWRYIRALGIVVSGLLVGYGIGQMDLPPDAFWPIVAGVVLFAVLHGSINSDRRKREKDVD
jgi:hypothetical protein